MPDRLVVVGGGGAGMSAASAARRVDPDLQIVVAEASGYAAWGLCGLPYYLAGVVDRAEDLVAYPPGFFRDERSIDLRLHTRVVGVDPGAHTVTLEHDGERSRLGYDRLVVAAGGGAVRPPLPGLDHDRVFTLRALEDARRLRSLLDAGRIGRALVVGAGYIGLEAAEALAARRCEVVVVEQMDRVLPTLDRQPAARVEAEVRRHADLRLQTPLHGVSSADGRLRASVGDTEEPVDVVVLGVGVRPRSELLAGTGAATSPAGGLVVDERQRTSLPDVLAAGDCVATPHRIVEGPAYVPLGPAANKMGKVAGTVAAGGDATFPGVVGTAVVKVFDLTVARTGLTLQEAEQAGTAATVTDVDHRSRAKYYPGAEPTHVRLVHEPGGRLLGAQMISRDPATAKRIDVIATALHAGFDVTRLAELDLSYAPPYAPVYDPVLIAARAAASHSRSAPARAG